MARLRYRRAVDRLHGGVEQFRDLSRVPSQHLAQDQHRPLARREMPERNDEREPHRLARDRHLGRIAAAPHDRVVPSHPDQRVFRRSVARRCRWWRDRRHIHWPGATPAPVEHVDAHIGRDAIQPRTQRRPAFEAVVAAPHARTIVSCTASSASNADPSIRWQYLVSSTRCRSSSSADSNVVRICSSARTAGRGPHRGGSGHRRAVRGCGA